MSSLEKKKLPSSSLVLKQCEAIIEEELENFKKLTRALELIEQMKLYEGQYDDFKSYCQNRWETTLNLITKENK